MAGPAPKPPPRRKGRPQRNSTLRQGSERQRARDAEWARSVAARKRVVDRCEARDWAFPCRGPLEGHHALPRRYGDDSEGNARILCRAHHVHVHEGDRAGAIERGLVVKP
jgi:hypothetical protein